jgi:hypothetical protein
MKFWRRHKHELSPNEGDEPLPAPPDKKVRYSKEDDALLAKYFYNKPDGTSDKIFQAFGRLVRQLLCTLLVKHVLIEIFYRNYSILTIRGRDGKSITAFTRPKSSI